MAKSDTKPAPVSVTLLQPVQHDMQDYAIGAVLQLPEAQAQALLDCGAATLDQPSTQAEG